MTKSLKMAGAFVAAVSLGGCGTVMTRPYEPVSEPPEAAKEAAFADAFDACVLDVTGQPAVIYRGEKTASGVGLGGTAGGMTAAGVTGAAIGGYEGLALVAVALPVAAGYGAVRGIAVLNRDNKETDIQAKVTQCMAAKNYKIVDWRLVKKGEPAAMTTPVAKPGTLK